MTEQKPDRVREILDEYMCELCDGQLDQATQDVRKAMAEEILELAGKATDSLMYDFPKSYTNSNIAAFQKGLDKLYVKFTAIIKKVGNITKEE